MLVESLVKLLFAPDEHPLPITIQSLRGTYLRKVHVGDSNAVQRTGRISVLGVRERGVGVASVPRHGVLLLGTGRIASEEVSGTTERGGDNTTEDLSTTSQPLY